MRLFATHGDMTTPEMAKYADGPTLRKAPSILEKFNILEVVGKKDGNDLYRLTQYGRDVLEDKQRCPKWIRDCEYLSENQRFGPRMFLSEMTDEHPYNDPKAHVEHSIPSPVSQ